MGDEESGYDDGCCMHATWKASACVYALPEVDRNPLNKLEALGIKPYKSVNELFRESVKKSHYYYRLTGLREVLNGGPCSVQPGQVKVSQDQ